MESFKNITIDFRHYGMKDIDIAISDQLTAHQLFSNLMRDLEIKPIEVATIAFKIGRTSDIITQQETLHHYDVRSGDVLILM